MVNGGDSQPSPWGISWISWEVGTVIIVFLHHHRRPTSDPTYLTQPQHHSILHHNKVASFSASKLCKSPRDAKKCKMSNRFDELRAARKEGRPLHPSVTSNQNPDRFDELRTARREDRPLYQPNTSKKRDGTTDEPHSETRYRSLTPHHIEHCRREEVDEAYPEGDSPLIDALRRRSRSSPPPLTRAPTPHPRTSAPRLMKKSVRWADPLEEPTPEKIRSERKRRNSEPPRADVEETQKEGQSCTIRRYRPSTIPRPKRRGSGAEISKPSCSDRRPAPSFTIELVLAPQADQSSQRPLSPLIPQAMPAPLRTSPIKTSTRRIINTISPSVSTPAVQVIYLQSLMKIDLADFQIQGQAIYQELFV